MSCKFKFCIPICLHDRVDFVTVKNTGSRVLRISSGGKTYELEKDDEEKIVPSPSDYLVRAGNTVIAIIRYPFASSFQVQKGDVLSGAEFTTTVKMTAGVW